MPTGNTQKGADGLPFGSVVTDGIADPAALQGGTQKTDSQGHTIAPALMQQVDGNRTTYVYSILGVAPAAAPTDWVTIKGSATTTVKIIKVVLGGIATTAGGISWQMVKRTAANTAGTSTAPALNKYDTNDATPTAIVALYSANPTGLGAGVNIRTGRLFLPLAAAQSDRVSEEFGTRPGAKAVVLRGVAEFFCINLNGSTLPAGTALDLTIELTEE